jgi:hypothetical protein
VQVYVHVLEKDPDALSQTVISRRITVHSSTQEDVD